jgi:TolA-binding protein
MVTEISLNKIAARNRLMARVLLGLALATSSAPLAAQADPEGRLKKMEAEVRALQRKVFPEGGGRFFGPEIAPRTASPQVGPAGPAASPVTDLIVRLDAVESTLARATAQAEETANRMSKLEARLATLEAGGAATGVGTSPGDATPPSSITGGVAANAAGSAPRLAAPPPERLAAVAGVVKPISDDPGEDDYLYGYRLWEAKYFPEAQQQLKLAIEKYPQHKRISYSRNLLGRAYLDDGKPGMAAQVFLQNYQADKAGGRAPDSLLFLAVAMTRLKETNRACVALAEFADAYPAEAAGRLASQYAAAKSAVQCN